MLLSQVVLQYCCICQEVLRMPKIKECSKYGGFQCVSTTGAAVAMTL